MNSRKTPLHRIHLESGARMVDFAGWEMPVQYGSALREHQSVRQAVGLFDISHMGEMEIVGEDALAMSQKVTCNDLARLSDGQAQYSAFLYAEGTFVDDVVVYRISAQRIFICVNAANREKDVRWVSSQKEGRVEIQDTSHCYAQFALQGPLALPVLQQLTDIDLKSIRYYWFRPGEVEGAGALISRTGYTGEDGFEIYIPPESAETIWKRLLEVGAAFGIQPAGLAARNTLRLEMCYPLYGHEIDETIDAWEAGLGWIVKLEKGRFIGREKLEELRQRGPRRQLVAFEMVGRGIARDHYPVFLNGRKVSQVTSGSFAPSLGKNVGLTYLPIEHSQIGQPLEVEIRGKLVRAQVVQRPFYQRAR